MGIIRILLAFAVLSHHAVILDQELLPGTVSVRLFFILSGFYMSLILDGDYRGRGVGMFYSNRLLRLFPAYLLVAALSLALVLAADAHPFMERSDLLAALAASPGTALWVVLSNLAIVGQDTLFLFDLDEAFFPVFAPCQHCPVLGFWMSLVPQAWSIAVELWFYLLAPILVRFKGRWLLPLALASLGLHVWLATHLPEGENVAHHFFPAQLYLFLAGIMAQRWCARTAHLGARLGPAALAAIVGGIFGYQHMADPWRFPLLAAIFFLGAPLVFNAMRDVRWDRLLGELSYPFYLVQFLVLALLEHFVPEGVPAWAQLGLVSAAAIAIYLLVDKPVTRWRWGRLARLAIPAQTAQGPALIAAGGPQIGTNSSYFPLQPATVPHDSSQLRTGTRIANLDQPAQGGGTTISGHHLENRQ